MTAEHPLARLARIWRYPVKSLAATALERVCIGADGLEGDRRSALFVASKEHRRSGKTFRGKEHNLLHTLCAPADAIARGATGGIELRERGDGPFFDAGSVSILFDRWLEELEGIVGMKLDPLRFRPNLFARTKDATIPPEREFIGTLFHIGDVVLRAAAPIERCVTPTYDVATGEPEPEVLRAVTRERENVMGVYCTVERAGEVALDDAIVADLKS